jgi:hypothetical protein
VAVGDENQGRIPVAIPANSAGRVDELVNLLRGQMLPRSALAVREAPGWSNFPVSGRWRPLSNCRDRRRNRGGYPLTFSF